MHRLLASAIVLSALASDTAVLSAQDGAAADKDLAADLEMLQGSWQLLHGNEGQGPPTIRSVKTVKGNKETLRRYHIATGEQFHEHTIEFKLTKSGGVRVFTFFSVGDSPENGLSFVYKVDKGNFYDIPGLLHGNEYRNYQPNPRVWHWKRVPQDKRAGAGEETDSGPDDAGK